MLPGGGTRLWEAPAQSHRFVILGTKMRIWLDSRIVAGRLARWFGTIFSLAIALAWGWSCVSPLRLPFHKSFVATDSRHILLIVNAEIVYPERFAEKILSLARERGTSIYWSPVLFDVFRFPFWLLFVLPGIPTILIWWSHLAGMCKASGVCGVRVALSILAIAVAIAFVISGRLELYFTNWGACSAKISNGCLELRSPADVATLSSSWITCDDAFCVGRFFVPDYSNSTGNLSEWLLRIPMFPCFLVAWTWLSWRLSMLFVPRPILQCSRCAYNLTGNVSGVCPECGGPVERMNPK